LLAEIISDELIFPHWHLREPSSIKLVVDSVYIIRTMSKVSAHSGFW
jgi:hypothetical protein